MTLKKYPDVSELFRRMEARRRVLSQMPVAQKMEIVRKLRDVSNTLIATRAANKELKKTEQQQTTKQ